MPRIGHHRVMYRTGPHYSWAQRKAYHLMKVLKVIHASVRMSRSMRCLSPGVYAIPPADRLAWMEAIDNAEPYAQDNDGSIWA